jgi:hypothetical protein
MHQRSFALAAAGALTTFIVIAFAPAASAHAQRQDGPIHLEIGFGNEPAYAGQPNSAQIILTDNGKPVVDLGDALNLTVSFGGQETQVPIEPNFEVGGDGEPGDYRAWFIPSQPGPYTFHITGTVHGTKVDEKLTSGSTTFDEVKDPSEAMFPAVNSPTTDDLAARIDSDAGRLTAAQAAVADVRDSVGSTKTVATIGVLVGAASLIVAVVALVLARRRSSFATGTPAMATSTKG